MPRKPPTKESTTWSAIVANPHDRVPPFTAMRIYGRNAGKLNISRDNNLEPNSYYSDEADMNS